MPWLGPFTIHEIIKNKICQLKNETKILKTKVLVSNIKKYYEPDDKEANDIVLNEEPIKSTSKKDETDVENSCEERTFNPVGKIWQQLKC